MSADHLTQEARLENALMLASVLGFDTADAGEALQFHVAVTADQKNAAAMAIAKEFATILRRTIRDVYVNDGYDTAKLEIIIGQAKPRSRLEKLFLAITADAAVIGDEPRASPCEAIPAIFTVIVACYLSAAVMQKIFKDGFPYGGKFPVQIRFDAFGIDPSFLSKDLDIGDLYLAGAGAIGNGLLWSFQHLNVHGLLNIVDDDVVSSGNLNRQIWFTREDIGKPKAERLALLAQPSVPALKLVPHKCRLQELPERSEGPWLKRLIIAVDSRRARRALQKEFPGEIFDASTTDIREVVIYHNKQPTEAACLSCIYESDEEELSRETHIAEHLGGY